MNTNNDQNSTASDPGESYLELENTIVGVDADASLNETPITDGNGERIELSEDGSDDDHIKQ